MSNTDLALETFLALQAAFFHPDGSPRPFDLRDKANTQDDPLDEHIAAILGRDLVGARCERASGPLISPDMVVFREEQCNDASRESLQDDLSCIVGLEVKKLERARNGQVARSSGLDYNTTPPCGTLRVYDAGGRELDIAGYYLFVCQEKTEEGRVFLSALTLCDGNALNADFKLYLEITGTRKKGIGLGTYGDGMNRNRPMLVFSNPLGAPQLDKAVTLLSRSVDLVRDERVKLAFEVGRTLAERAEDDEGLSGVIAGGVVAGKTASFATPNALFYAYRRAEEIGEEWEVLRYQDPFPKPATRVEATQGRGKFRVPIRPQNTPDPATGPPPATGTTPVTGGEAR